MNMLNLQFHHYGLAAVDDKPALIFLENLGYDLGQKIYDPEQNVHVQLCTSEIMPAVEIVTEGVGEGPLKSILKRGSEMIYHSCYITQNLPETLAKIEALGLRIITLSPPKKAILFNNKMVSFYHVMGFGIIELLED